MSTHTKPTVDVALKGHAADLARERADTGLLVELARHSIFMVAKETVE